MWASAVVGVASCQRFSLNENRHHIASPNFLDSAALALDPAETRGDDQRLAEPMGAMLPQTGRRVVSIRRPQGI